MAVWFVSYATSPIVIGYDVSIVFVYDITLLLSMAYTFKAGKSDCTDLWVIKPTNYATSCLSRGVDVDFQSYLLTNKW